MSQEIKSVTEAKEVVKKVVAKPAQIVEERVEAPSEPEIRTAYELELEAIRKERAMILEIEKERKKLNQAKLLEKKVMDSKMVRGRFTYHECPRGLLEFVYGKYEGQAKKYAMKDGEMYTIPLMVANHINEAIGYKVMAYKKNEEGNTVAEVGETVRRASFARIDF